LQVRIMCSMCIFLDEARLLQVDPITAGEYSQSVQAGHWVSWID
jgi:hypothetical protein